MKWVTRRKARVDRIAYDALDAYCRADRA